MSQRPECAPIRPDMESNNKKKRPRKPEMLTVQKLQAGRNNHKSVIRLAKVQFGA